MSLRVDLKSQETRRGFSFDYGWIVVAVVILFAFVVFYFFGLQLQKAIDERNSELKVWQDKVAGFAPIKGKLEAVKKEIGSIQTQINYLRELRYDPLRYSILMVRLSKLIPSNIWISSLTVEPNTNSITLQGSSIDLPGRPPLASIAEMIMNLQNDKDSYFSNVTLQSTSSAPVSGKSGAPTNTWSFGMQASYNIPLITSSSPASGTPGAVPPPVLAPPPTSEQKAPPVVSPANNAPSPSPSQAVSPSPNPKTSPTPKATESPKLAPSPAPKASPTPSASSSPSTPEKGKSDAGGKNI